MVYPNLRKSMADHGISLDDLARWCGITTIGCWLRMYGLLPWKYTEVVRICQLLGNTDAELLFVRLDIIS
jgi:hypothetical protein